ncbi:MAG: polyribonucleotide nucleotidyltransferase [Candidatus Promineifilaceae bacterium]
MERCGRTESSPSLIEGCVFGRNKAVRVQVAQGKSTGFMSEKIFTTQVGAHKITVSTGKLAEQAGGAVTFRQGDSMLFTSTTMSKNVREGLDFFPLSVDFEEKMYAAGRIPGSFFRREGRASTRGVLTARLTDRPLRPLFPKGMRNEVQVIITSFAADEIHHLDIMAVNAASCALTISDIPWNGPIGAIRVGYIDGQLIANPTIPEMLESSLDLRLAGSRDAIIMVEAGANEATEELMVEALAFGHEALQPLIDLQLEMRAAVGKVKREVVLKNDANPMTEAVQAALGDRLFKTISEHTERHERGAAVGALTDAVVAEFVAEDEEADTVAIRGAIQKMTKAIIRDRILQDGIRPDGRAHDKIRALSSEVGLLPRTHGSGLFKRGETQVLSVCTLGMPREAQKIDNIFSEPPTRYMHHYNFPPYSTGETWFLRGPKRREIGHGALAENALRPVIPSEDDFPYTIRVVSEVLSSNGSTSQGSVCASTLALMDCGVPIRKPVAGVAMGLIYDDETGMYAILSDIQGMEDHLGDMDFKVAGTPDGITAIQMDIKISGLSMELMADALAQAKVGRLTILDNMAEAMAAPRPQLSDNAPRMMTVKIEPDKIGAVIGKGGATVRSIQEQFGVDVDIQEDGTVLIAGADGGKSEMAKQYIEQLTKEMEPGETYTGKVTRIVDFGCFVELMPGQEGLVHISQLAPHRIESVESVVKLGDEIMVMVTAVDSMGKVRLSRKAVLNGWSLEEAQADDAGGRRGGGGGRGGDRRGGGRGGDRRGGGRGGDRRGGGGGGYRGGGGRRRD